jgi:biotin carboxyl carrier protein
MPILSLEGKKYRIGNVVGEDPSWTVPVDEKKVDLEVLRETSAQAPTLWVRAGGRVIRVSVQRHEDQLVYFMEVNGRPLTVVLEEDVPLAHLAESRIVEGPVFVNSPMAGKIGSVKTSVGARVEEGQSLVVLEAMKMENEIASPKNGTVKEIYAKSGDLVKAGDRLCLIA